MRASAAVALMVLAAACTAATPAPTQQPPPTTTRAATTTTLATGTSVPPTTTTTTPVRTPGPPGAVVVGPGEPIQIRVLQTLSGEAEPFGRPQLRAIERVIADFGPVHGHQVEIGEPYDDRCSPDGGRAAAEAIATEPGVLPVLGATCAGATAQAADLLHKAGIPLISSSSTAPELTSDTRSAVGRAWRPGFFRTSPNDAEQAVVAARFAAELDVTRAAALHRGDPHTRVLAETFAATFRDLGGAAVTVHCKPCDETDVDAALAEMAVTKPEVLFLPVFLPEGALVLDRYRQVPGLEDATVLGGGGLAVDEVLTSPSSAGIHLVVADANIGIEAAAADAASMLLTAIADIATVDGDALLIDRAELRARLHATTGPGATGMLTCDRFGDCAGPRFRVVRHDIPGDIAATHEVFSGVQGLFGACHPAVTDADSEVGPQAQAATVEEIEAWALFFPHRFTLRVGDSVRLPAGEDLKIVFRVTGLGDPEMDAIGPGGVVFSPTDGPDRHQGSNWDRPGDEYGTGWELPEPGCWTIRIVRNGRVASLVVEAYAP